MFLHTDGILLIKKILLIYFNGKNQKKGKIQKAVINLVSNIDTDYYKIDLYLFTEDDFFEDKHKCTISGFFAQYGEGKTWGFGVIS